VQEMNELVRTVGFDGIAVKLPDGSVMRSSSGGFDIHPSIITRAADEGRITSQQFEDYMQLKSAGFADGFIYRGTFIPRDKAAAMVRKWIEKNPSIRAGLDRSAMDFGTTADSLIASDSQLAESNILRDLNLLKESK
jgi:hypothetical protein